MLDIADVAAKGEKVDVDAESKETEIGPEKTETGGEDARGEGLRGSKCAAD